MRDACAVVRMWRADEACAGGCGRLWAAVGGSRLLRLECAVAVAIVLAQRVLHQHAQEGIERHGGAVELLRRKRVARHEQHLGHKHTHARAHARTRTHARTVDTWQ